jgi:hypothetical protein
MLPEVVGVSEEQIELVGGSFGLGVHPQLELVEPPHYLVAVRGIEHQKAAVGLVAEEKPLHFFQPVLPDLVDEDNA